MSEPVTPPTEPVDPAQAVEPPPAETDWKAEARKWEQRAKDNASKLKDAEPKLAEYDKLTEASKTELERKNEEVTRWQSEAERWRSSSVQSRIEALASNDFADPTDAVAAISADPAKYLGVDGVINDEAIRTELAAVLEKKPHWRKAETSAPAQPRLPLPNGAQGSGANGKTAANPAVELAAIIQGQLNGP